jgi:hypothetical protein
MSRILKRPMFRKGGEVMEGIMTGIKPRQNYSLGQRVEDYKNVMRAATAGPSTGPDALTRFLLESGEKLIGGESAGGTKLQEIVGSTKDPMQNYFASLDKKAQQEKSIGLQGAILGIKGQQDIDKAKAQSQFQKEFSPDRKEYELFKEYSNPNVKNFKKSIRQMYPKSMAKFDAKTSSNLDNVEEFKGKNVQIFPSKISGSKVQFNFDEMIPGTIYFRPDQQNSMFERDPENNVIIQYNIFTGEKIKEIKIGG